LPRWHEQVAQAGARRPKHSRHCSTEASDQCVASIACVLTAATGAGAGTGAAAATAAAAAAAAAAGASRPWHIWVPVESLRQEYSLHLR